MKTNAFPRNEAADISTGCCYRFNPEGWDNQHLHFEDKKFVRATTRSAMHIPWNMGQVFTRVQEHIEDASQADPETEIVISRDLSPWEAEHFFAVDNDIEGEEMTTLSGDYFTRVFEGSYRRVKDFEHDMEVAAIAMGKSAKRIYFFYTTCPKCAKAYGKNYIVGVAEV